jgi:hypothetical protein
MIEKRSEAELGREGTDSMSSRRHKSVRRSAMQVRINSVFAAIIALGWSVQFAQAGAIRYAAKALHQGSIAAVQKTSDVPGTAVRNFEDASKAAGATLKDTTATLKKDVGSAPGMAVRRGKEAANKIWKAVW